MKRLRLFSERKDKANQRLIEEIILQQYNQYYRLAYSYVHNETDAGDIVQNGAYRALKNSHTLKQPEYAQTWVYRIMLNECFRYLKQPKFLSYETLQENNGLGTDFMEDHYTNVDLKKVLFALYIRD